MGRKNTVNFEGKVNWVYGNHSFKARAVKDADSNVYNVSVSDLDGDSPKHFAGTVEKSDPSGWDIEVEGGDSFFDLSLRSAMRLLVDQYFEINGIL